MGRLVSSDVERVADLASRNSGLVPMHTGGGHEAI